jgi:formate/nitrite transporter FocA (FNT family)
MEAIFLPRQARDKHRENSKKRPFSYSSRLIARRPMAFLVPGVLAGLASGLSGAWVILVDQELQSERLGAGNALISPIFLDEK